MGNFEGSYNMFLRKGNSHIAVQSSTKVQKEEESGSESFVVCYTYQ